MWLHEGPPGSNEGVRTPGTFSLMSLTNRLPARFTLAHGLMILAGLLTFVLVNRALSDNRETVVAYFATEEAVAGRTFTPDVDQVPADTPGVQFFATEEELRSKVLVRTIQSGQIIMSSDLVPKGSLSFRTFAIPVEDYHIRGLGLTRNDRVDVVGFDDDDNPVYLATDLVVDSTSASSVSEGLGATARDTYITVQVDDAQALQLALGQQNGPLHLVRSTGASPVSVAAVPEAAAGSDDETAEGDRP